MNRGILIRTVLLGALLVCSMTARAELVWSGNLGVSEIIAVDNGGFLIGFTAPVDPACTQWSTKHLYVYPGEQGLTLDVIPSYLALGLSALTTGAEVKAHYDNATPLCHVKYLQISR